MKWKKNPACQAFGRKEKKVGMHSSRDRWWLVTPAEGSRGPHNGVCGKHVCLLFSGGKGSLRHRQVKVNGE